MMKPFSPQHGKKQNPVWGSSRRAWEATTPALLTLKEWNVQNEKLSLSAQSKNITFSGFRQVIIKFVTQKDLDMNTYQQLEVELDHEKHHVQHLRVPTEIRQTISGCKSMQLLQSTSHLDHNDVYITTSSLF